MHHANELAARVGVAVIATCNVCSLRELIALRVPFSREWCCRRSSGVCLDVFVDSDGGSLVGASSWYGVRIERIVTAGGPSKPPAAVQPRVRALGVEVGLRVELDERHLCGCGDVLGEGGGEAVGVPDVG